MANSKVNRKDFLFKLELNLRQKLEDDKALAPSNKKLSLNTDDLYDYILKRSDSIFDTTSKEESSKRLAECVEQYIQSQLSDKMCASPEQLADIVFSSVMEEAENVICSGKNISIHGFGTFYLTTHKGHPVQFKDDSHHLEDYVVLKFKASDVFMTKVRDLYKNGELSVQKGRVDKS